MRTLLIRPGAIGDCILSLPVLQYLRSDYTEIWAPSQIVPLLSFASRVRAIANTGLDLLGVGDLEPSSQIVDTLRSFDRIVSWYGANRPEFVQAIRRIAAHIELHPALPPADYPGHATDFFAQQVHAPFGLIPRIEVQPEAFRDAVVIHPFSGSPRKNWPLECFRETAAALKCPVQWCAGPDEPLTEAHRFSNLGELAAWVRGARLYVGNDSGITHLAAATGMPVLALFGPTNPKTWAPRGANVAVVATATRSAPMRDLESNRILQEILRLLV